MKNRFGCIVALMLVCVFFSTAAALAAGMGEQVALQKGHEALHRLYEARESKEITQVEFLRQAGFLLFAPEQMDPKFRPEAGSAIKCGTLLLRELKDNMHLLSPGDQSYFSPFLARPTNQFFYDTPGGHFRIWYDTTGANAIYQAGTDVNPADGVPDFVNRAAESSEVVWTEETTAGGNLGLDYDAPPSDGTGGGNSRFDLYFQSLGAGLYGVTYAEGSGTGTYPDRPGCRYSYISLHKNFFWTAPDDPVLALRVTIAHEYQHAVQFAYSALADSAFMENCSTNMEELVYDEINDYYTWINPRYQNPHKQLKEFDGQIEYATCIWPMFITQRYGHVIVKNVWNTLISANNIMDAYEATFAVAPQRTLAQMYQEFTTWFYNSAAYDDGHHYSEGAIWTTYITNGHARIERTHSTFPASGVTPTNAPDRLACNFINLDFSTTSPHYGVQLDFDGDPTGSITWGVVLIAYSQSQNTWTPLYFTGDTAGDIHTTVLDPLQDYTKMGMVVQNLRPYGSGVGHYSYSISVVTTPQQVPAVNSLAIAAILLILTGILLLAARRRKAVAVQPAS